VFFAITTALLLTAEPHIKAPIIQDAVALEEEGRWESPRSYDDTLKYYRRVFRYSGGVRWRHIVNLPGIKANHLQSLRKKTEWSGINIYEDQGHVRIYVIKRPEPPPEKKKRKKRRRRGKKS